MTSTMTSSWEFTKKRSIYHFDKWRMDPRWDAVVGLGRIAGDWEDELDAAVKSSVPGTWANRGYKGEGVVSPDLAAEEYDLIKAGADPKMNIAHFVWKMTPKFQKITDLLHLKIRFLVSISNAPEKCLPCILINYKSGIQNIQKMYFAVQYT